MTRVLVTGASGFAGTHLVERLTIDDPSASVVGCYRPGSSRADAARALAPQAAWRPLDVLDRAAIRDILDDVRPTTIMHLAGAPQVHDSWSDPTHALEINFLGTHHLLAAVADTGLPCRVVIAGSAHVYEPSDRALTEASPVRPTSPYALSKLAQEMRALEVAADAGLAVIVARAFNHFGPRQEAAFVASSFARQIARIEAGAAPPVLEVGNLDARRDLTDVRDTVRAYRLLGERGTPGRTYNVCSGATHQVRELLDVLCSLARANVRVQLDPARLRPSDVPLLLGDPTRLQTDTGWRPEIPFEQTLADLLAYWRGREPAAH